MKAGHRTEVRGGTIDNKGLRRFNAEAARRAVLEIYVVSKSGTDKPSELTDT